MLRIATQKNGVNGLWIAAPGYDATTAGPDNLNLSTDHIVAQPVAAGTATFSMSGTSGSASVYCGDLEGYTNLIRWVTYWIVYGGSIYVPDQTTAPGGLGQMDTWVSGNTLVMSVSNLNFTGMQVYASWILYRTTY